MVKISLTLAAFLAATGLAAPQAGRFGCGTHEPTAELIEAAQSMSASEADFAQQGGMSIQATIEVDLYIHVVSAGTALSDGNVPDSQLSQQVVVLNNAYAPYGVHFNLKGTDRTVNSQWANNQNELAMKRALRKGGYSALNLYFQKSAGSGILGFCYFPTSFSGTTSTTFIQDGCTILYSTTPGGSSSPFNLGGTATHEVGHWMGLFHTFQGGCTGAGDSVADTPAQSSPSSGCPVGRDSCPSQAGVDPIHNYMDYSDDACYSEFTTGQATRMASMWNTYRAGK
ncbi:metalloprotease [Microdochium bolleyi]|uniref:Metalloprotease n=1 Tax=Microdochium bolleyi TaxID=196109 RepID=A0A136J443_9PEZI|nr:metalloprotease [Microdochium bolleyi]